jgi:hypothetical protein
VSFIDHRQVQLDRSAGQSSKRYAAVIFKYSVVEDPTWAAGFVVEVLDKPNTYRVRTEEMNKWLARNGRSPKELVEKKRLRELQGTDHHHSRW